MDFITKVMTNFYILGALVLIAIVLLGILAKKSK